MRCTTAAAQDFTYMSQQLMVARQSPVSKKEHDVSEYPPVAAAAAAEI
jgi:hypothetical protein